MAFALVFLFQYDPGQVRILLSHHDVALATAAFTFETKNFFWLINISFS